MITDKSQLYKGQIVVYSDLSAWEIAEVREVFWDEGMVTLSFDGGIICEGCMIDGIRTINWHQDEVTHQARTGKDLATV